MLDSKKFNVHQYTKAPLRLELTADFRAAPQALFDIISDHNAVANWVPLMKGVFMEYSPSGGNECNVGSVRHCSLHGMGGIDETILWWNPPQGYAFKVDAKSKMMMPTREHVSVMQIEPLTDGGSRLIWQHYFNWRGLFMRHMTSIMFPMMMRKALNNIHKELGEGSASACHANSACETALCKETCGNKH